MKILGSLLLSVGLISDCTGWSVLGYEVNKETDVIESIWLLDQDSTRHTYKNFIINEDNWCYEHAQYEYVKPKPKWISSQEN